MSAAILAALVVVDGALCGFRAAAGRNPRIRLAPYYRRAMLRGAALAAVVVLAFTAAGLAIRQLDGPDAWAALTASAARLIAIYAWFAIAVTLALGLYALGSFDLGVLATVLVLGPMTLARPLVIVAGAAWAAAHATTAAAAALTVAGALVMLGFERLLDLGRPPWRGLEGDRVSDSR